jgi:Xaa-Pro aminopeptidase
MTTADKVAALRDLMKQHDVAAYYVPSADAHQSEYLPECWKRRAWLSGFTGSAGELVVGRRQAGLWTDGRYFLQAEQQLAGSGIDLMRLGVPDSVSLTDWLAARLKPGEAVGVDPNVISVGLAANLEKTLAEHEVKVTYLPDNLVDRIWTGRPDPGLDPIELHAATVAGETAKAKLMRVRMEMREQGCQAHVIGALDAVAWLLNIRSRDILFTPVAIAYVVLTDRDCTLYVDPRKVSKSLAKTLGEMVKIRRYDEFVTDLTALAARKPRVWLDPATTNRRVQDLLAFCPHHLAPSPITAMRAVKNPTQIDGIAAAHVRDGVAMVKFLRWLETAVPAGGVTELSAAAQQRAFRAESSEYQDDSFETISGYAANGAIIHYGPTPESNANLRPRGLYLIDSGGQYPDGTTDITRTLALGPPTKRQKECFTRVLMGMLDCSRIPFPLGTTGRRIEMFARRHLWEAGLEYNHGTGHGVGQYLGVHEGPHSLKDLDTPPLREGNLLSIEPGYYEPGQFGIRIENLAVVTVDDEHSTEDRTWLRFHTITLCPIDLNLVEPALLTPDQVKQLNAYHKRVYQELGPHLDAKHKTWLRKATRAI